MARKKSVEDSEDMSIDLKPFINFLVVLIPVLMLSSEFAKISIINLKLPEGRGSNTEEAQKVRPLDDESDKLLLTMIITDSVVTIGAKNGFLPSLFYKEFHHYVAAEDRRVEVTVEYDPKNPGKSVKNPKTGKPFKLSERQEIFLYVADENYQVQKCLYTKDALMLTDADGRPMTSVKTGDTIWLVTNPRRQVVITDPSQYELKPLMAYDEMKNRLMKIKERYREARDADDIIIAAENQVAYDKIVQLMDVARTADFPNISIAKLRG
ncbi:MAG: biopolymer transporter ExbD [Chitinispirillaceae bacterium]|nr:biopolymer transporter ExbD [Chitinispirillaceae bacterium]